MKLAILISSLLFVAYILVGCSYHGWTYTESNLSYTNE